MYKYCLFLVFILMMSCSSIPSENISPYHSPSSTNGMIIGTIAIKNERPVFNKYFFHYVDSTDNDISVSRMITITPEQIAVMKHRPDFFDGDKAVYFFSIKEPVGNYKFVTLRVYSGIDQRLPMDIDFKIEKGNTKYIGEIYFDAKTGAIEFSNQMERDLPKLKEKFPLLTVE